MLLIVIYFYSITDWTLNVKSFKSIPDLKFVMVLLQIFLFLDLESFDDGRMLEEVEVSVVLVQVEHALDEGHPPLKVFLVRHANRLCVLRRIKLVLDVN